MAPALEQDAQEVPGSAFQGIILAEGLTRDPTLFIGPIQKYAADAMLNPKPQHLRRGQTPASMALPKSQR
jgi:hypothetical protein